MTGQQVYIYQDRNKAADSVIAMGVAAGRQAPLIYPVAKQGTGNIVISGAYTGQSDSSIDVEIVDTSFTAPVVSASTFKGAGTGKIKDIAVSGLAAQNISVLCMSTGVTTQSAEVEIEGQRFRALASGSAGNAITISIDNSPLVFTLTTYSTLKALKAGDSGLQGQEWDFDTKVILGEIVPDSAHRISFADDHLHIYRQYKKYEDGAYKYYFIQPIRYEVQAGSKVYFVTGGRTITLTDDITTEVYENIITIADFWQAVKAAPSNFIEPVNSTIDTSNTVESPAVRELTVMTDAYALPSYKNDKSSEYAGELNSVVVNELTKTELVSVECVDNTFLGEEMWAVKGSSSGALGQVKTGEFNGVGPVGFTIPQKYPKDWLTAARDEWSHKETYVSRVSGVTPPPICFSMKLGAKSVPQEFKMIYTKKPVECVCPVTSFSDSYLGFQEKGGEQGMSYTIPDLDFWLTTLKERMREEFSYTEGLETSYKTFELAFTEYEKTFRTLGARLMSLPENNATDLAAMLLDYKQLVQSIYFTMNNNYTVEKWQAEVPLSTLVAGAGPGFRFVVPTTPNGFYYTHYQPTVAAPVSGLSGEFEPTWLPQLNQQVYDSSLAIVWYCSNHLYRWLASSGNYPVGHEIMPLEANGFIYDAIVGGQTGGNEPVWPEVIGETIEDNEIVWRCKRAVVQWEAETEYAIGAKIVPTDNLLAIWEWTCQQILVPSGGEGETGAVEPGWPKTLGEKVEDGDVTWICYGTAPLWTEETYVQTGVIWQPSTPDGAGYLCISGGVTGAVEPEWLPIVDQYFAPTYRLCQHVITDGTVKWLYLDRLQGASYRWNGWSWQKGTQEAPNKLFPSYQLGSYDLSYDTELYQKIVDAILLYEITYGLKKNSIALTGDVPYEQTGDYYWRFEGGLKQYLPAYTDSPYYSVVNVCGCAIDAYVGTKEFALKISVPCGGSLLEGDIITVSINTNTERTYQLGDLTYLPTVAASDIELSGGIDGDDTYTFSVLGSVSSFPDYPLDRESPQPYAETGLFFAIDDGIVPFAVGDVFEFSIEGGHFRWRQDGGAWCDPLLSISGSPQSLADGLSIAFSFGVAPSFVVNDAWEVICLQENKPSNMVTPWSTQKAGGSGNIIFSFSSPVTIDCLLISDHTLTGTITFEACDDDKFETGDLIYTDTITVAEIICKVYPAGITAQYFRLVYSGAYEIGHCFLGAMLRLERDADSVVPIKRFNMQRQEGKRPFALLDCIKRGYTVSYSSFIRNNEYKLLESMVEFLKSANDMPLFFVPNIRYPNDCIKGVIDTDNLEIGSEIDMNAPESSRLYSVTLPVVGTY